MNPKLIYPNPRPTAKQIIAAISIAQEKQLPIPAVDYMTGGKLGEWIRLNSTRKTPVISCVTIITYADGTVETHVKGKK